MSGLITIYFLAFANLVFSKLPNNHEYNIKKQIFEDYDPTTRPVLEYNDRMKLEFSIALRALIDLDVEAASIKLSAWLYYYWTDQNLVWNATDFGGTEKIIVYPKDVWYPDFFLYN